MNKFSTWLWRTAFWLRYKVGYGLKVYGRDNFPMEGPVIVVPKHLSNNLSAAMLCLDMYTLWLNKNYL